MLRAIGLGPHLRLHGGNVLNHRVVTVPKGSLHFVRENVSPLLDLLTHLRLRWLWRLKSALVAIKR